ncbi:MAG: InlB B-repeat-containing protein [Prevotella sp.]|nr:InlB B-repeat-containing protein [Prevotella sp.]
MCKTENGTYSSTTITDLADESVLYVRLKAGLSNGTHDGTLTFSNADVDDDVVIDLSGSVTNQTYTVTYDLNGGNGDAPTEDPQEEDAVITLPAAPTKDFYTFDGWLSSANGTKYAAGASYTMTDENTTFTAQWKAPQYASSLDFAAITTAGTTGANPIATFLASGNMIATGLSSSAWETSTAKSGFIGYKLKDKGATVKFLVKAGYDVTITLGSVGADATLKKGDESTTISTASGDAAETVIPTFTPVEDMVVSLTTSSTATVTLKSIVIEKAAAYVITKGSATNGSIAVVSSADEGDVVDIVATPNTGYTFSGWTIHKTGDESTTVSPAASTATTTFTMPAYNVTVNATFTIVDYTITHNATDNGSYTITVGDGGAVSTNTTANYGQTVTLAATPDAGYILSSWSVVDAGSNAVSVTNNQFTMPASDVTVSATFTQPFTLTYDANGGTGSMSDTEGSGSITLTANAYTKSGYTFIGWATSQANADAGTVAYADGASYTLSANAILYAVWAENYFEFTPATSGDELAVGNVISGTGFGGFIKVAGLRYYQDAEKGTSIAYNASGLALTGGGADSLRVELNDYMQPGTIIVVKMTMGGTTAPRGLYINTTTAAHSRVELLGFQSEGFGNGQVGVFTYTVKADDGLAGRKSFGLQRQNSVYVKSITIVNCQPGATLTATGWSTYSSHKALDLSTLTDGFTAYVAKEINGGNVIMSSTNAIVPAETGLMIKGTASTKFTIDATSEEATFSGTNLLVAMAEGGTVTAANNSTEWNYVFGYENAETYGFYKINAEDATLGLGKAYLHTTTALATAGSARLGIIFDDETTGITSTAMQPSTEQYFNLAGQRVAQPTKGLYIVNGRKVVVK